MTIKEMRDNRANLSKTAKDLLNKSEAEKRSLTAEEQAQFDKLLADADALATSISNQERMEALEREQSASQRVTAPQEPGDTVQSRAADPQNSFEDEALAIQAWGAANTRNASVITDRHIAAAKRAGIQIGSKELVIRFGQGLGRRENRAIGDAPQTVTTTGGGYLVPPGSIAAQIERALLQYNPLEGVARQIVTASGDPMYFPTVNDTSNAGEMVSINTAVTEAAVTFGQVSLGAFKGSSKDVIIPYELFQDSAFNVISFIGDVLGERLGRLRAAQCTTGAGTTAPTGIVTAATSGGTTSSQTAITADELLTLLHSINPAYRSDPSFAWMMNDTTLLALRKLKDGQGRYLWSPDMAGPGVNQLFGKPVILNPAMASPAHSAKPVLAGAFSKFAIRTVGEVRIIQDPYTYSTKDQTLFVAFVRFDSNLLDAGTHPVKYLANA